jgi:hypothetical protein
VNLWEDIKMAAFVYLNKLWIGWNLKHKKEP